MVRRVLTVAAAALMALVLAPATDGGAAPAARTQRTVPACSTSKALFTKFPFPRSPHLERDPYRDFAAFQTTRAGTWAGVIYDDFTGDIRLIRWRRGHAPKVLARFRYRNVPYDPFGSVQAVGITPTGVLITSIQNPAVKSWHLAQSPRRGFYWVGKHRHLLAHHGTWSAWSPVSVTDSGEIVGWAATGSLKHPHYYAVTWAHYNHRPTVLADLGSASGPMVVADRAGDIAYTPASNYAVVRMASGARHELRARPLTSPRYESEGIYPSGASRHSIYASTGWGIVQWQLSGQLPAGPLAGHVITGFDRGDSFVDAVSPRGDVVADIDHAYLRTSSGARHRIPAHFPSGANLAWTFNNSGLLAYTSSRGYVHFLRCG